MDDTRNGKSLSEKLKSDIKRSRKREETAEFNNFVDTGGGSGGAGVTTQPETDTHKFQNSPTRSIKINISSTSKFVKAEEFEIKWFDKNIDKMLDKSVVFYGASGTGKTKCIYDLVFRMKEHLPKVFVFAPTNEDKHDFDEMIPNLLIYEKFDCSDIKKIYMAQQASASTYNRANNIRILRGLFNKLAGSNEITYINKLDSEHNAKLKNIKGEEPNKEMENYINDYYKTKKIKYFKKIIEERYKKLGKNITEDEAYCITYRYFNPRILVIFDDAINEIRSLMRNKKDGSVITDFFFKGRWAYITHFYAFQDEANLDTGLKKNGYFSIFTDANMARGFFTRVSMMFGPQDKARAMAAIDAIFPSSKDDTEKKYNKLVFARMEENRFQYTRADNTPKFRMCDPIIWKYCEIVAKKQNESAENNPYLNGFKKHL